MSLYQPSFAYPHNQSIDCTDEDDMKFSWQLNGNNLLCGYNIQIYDLNSNELIWELISTEEQRDIESQIEKWASYINNQDLKLQTIDDNEIAFKEADFKKNFKTFLLQLNGVRQVAINSYNNMVQAKSQGRVQEYMQEWNKINNQMAIAIENTTNETLDDNCAEYIRQQCEDWLDVDPAREPNEQQDISYETKIVQTNIGLLNKMKNRLLNSQEAWTNASTLLNTPSESSIICDATLNLAKQVAYSIYSTTSNEPYYYDDLYTAVCNIVDSVNFDNKRIAIESYKTYYQSQVTQLTYALSFFTGGTALEIIPIYSAKDTEDVYFLINVEVGGSIATIGTVDGQGWYKVCYQNVVGYAQLTAQNFAFYNIATKDYKYILDKPVPPTNFEGKPNVITHQLPTNWEQFPEGKRLENGYDYKWVVTLFWNTSGDYTRYENIDGVLRSVEYYFNTRKKPKAYLKNWKEILTIPNNKVQIKENTTISYEYEGEIRTKDLAVGDYVTLLHYSEEGTLAHIKVESEEVAFIYGDIPAESIVNGGYYEDGENENQLYELQSKYATFLGGYEQEQHTSIAYFRWVLNKLQYDTEEVIEVVKDTGMIPSIDVKMYYDGFLNNEKYSIKLYIQTLDNIEVESIEYKFEVKYIDMTIENMVNAENSPIEHGIIVEWSNLKLIQGEISGDSHYTRDLPTEKKTTLSLDKGSSIVFDKDKGKGMSLDWNANQIISIRFDEDRAPSQEYYTAVGKDDNGGLIYKSLRLEEREDTDDTGIEDLIYTIHMDGKEPDIVIPKPIIVSPLYWYIIIMTSDDLIVYVKYADGLFPMRELYASLNDFTHSNNVVPLPLRYYNEPSERVNYNYQTIINRDGSYK